jgi:hypothetical protein
MADIKRRGQKTTESLLGKLNFEQDRNRIIGRDNNNIPRLQILADGEQFNFKVSVPGINVTTATNLQLSYNSDDVLFKIVEEGQVDLFMDTLVDGASATAYASALHSQDYSPLVLAFVSYASPQVPGEVYTRLFGGSYTQAKSVNTTQVTIGYSSEEEVLANTTGINFSWRVYNSTGIAQPPITKTVTYYILDKTAPDA